MHVFTFTAARAAVACACALGATAWSQPSQLAGAGCPMAHCDARMSDAVLATAPSRGDLVAFDAGTAGARTGLGCSANLAIAACSTAGENGLSTLLVFDALGHRLWEDGGQLGSSAWASAPLILTDGTVIGASADWLMRVDPLHGRVLWLARKPDSGTPISPVLVGTRSTMVLLGTHPANDWQPTVSDISTWDVDTGALLWHQPLTDAANGRTYETKNTPAVAGARAYLSTEAHGVDSDGRLVAIDVCDASDCGVRGKFTLAWHYDFRGPSGASPLLVGKRLFFDGSAPMRQGVLMAVDDLGTAPRLVWRKTTAETTNVSPAQDPRGGLWVNAFKADSLARVDANTGATVQQVNAAQVLGLPAGYDTASALSVSTGPAGEVVLTIGLIAWGQDTAPTYAASIDVSSAATGKARWLYRMGDNLGSNAAPGQFPEVITPSGARRVVVQGRKAGTFFLGEP